MKKLYTVRKTRLGADFGSDNELLISKIRLKLKKVGKTTKNTGVSCHALLQGIFPNQRSNPGLPNCRQILYQLSYEGSLKLFMYDINQIPYDYTVEVRNRFKGLDLIECLKTYG